MSPIQGTKFCRSSRQESTLSCKWNTGFENLTKHERSMKLLLQMCYEMSKINSKTNDDLHRNELVTN